MWMIGYNDVGELISIPDSFNGVNLPPLIPSPANNAPCLTRFHATDLLALNHHLSIVAEVEQSRRELLSRQQVNNVVSSRWNPTPEQLETLEELYRRGTRTPSADQIQHITAQLRQYGKIEGKNVFYWFQNHKTRDRQKRRRRHQQFPDKESGASRTGFEVDEQTKNWVFPTDCSTLLAEKNASLKLQGAAKAAVPECITGGWVELEEEEAELQQQRRSLVERNAMWQMMHSSCSPLTHHLMNNTNNHTTSRTIMDPKRTRDDQDLMKIFIAPARDDLLDTVGNYYYQADDDEAARFEGAAQTLQLFPLRSDNDDDDDDAGNENNSEETAEISLAADFTPYQFFEFLPLKN